MIISFLLAVTLIFFWIPVNALEVEQDTTDSTVSTDILSEKTLSILGDSISTFTNHSNGTAAETTNSTIGSGDSYVDDYVDATGSYKPLEALMERGSVSSIYDLGYSSDHYNNYVRSAFDIKTGGAARMSIEKFAAAHGTIYIQFFASDYTKISSVSYTDQAVVNIPNNCDFIRIEIRTSEDLESIVLRFYDGSDEPREAKRAAKNEVSEKLTYKVSDDVHTTSRLMLPPNYSIDGEKVPLILWLEGSGSGLSSWNGDFNSNKLPYLRYLRDEGFAVFSVYAWGNQYAEKYPACGSSFPYPVPTNLACIKEGIEYICSRYNIDADNIHIMSKSQGGQCALYYASCNELNAKTIGMFAPVLDYLSMPGEAMYKDTRAAIADDLDFTGDIAYFASDRFLSYSDEGRAFLRENLDKLLILNEAWTNLSGATPEELFESSMDDCETFWTEEIWKTDRTDIYTHTDYVKTASVPVKIWGAKDDASTPYLKMVEVVEQLKNGGSVAELRTLPGGHSCADTGPTRVDVTTALGIEHKNVPIGWVENVQWIRSNGEVHTHTYTATVTAPTCTEQGYTTYTCACGDSYVADYADALNHDYAAAVTYPTGVIEGYTDYTCSVCGDSYRTPWLDKAAYEGMTIACVGDSITAAYGVTKDETDYVTLLAEQLGMNYIRLGASGTTLCTDGSRTCNIGKLTEANLNGADVVTIAMGINDFCAAGAGHYELGDIHSTDTSTIYGAARMWCERIAELRKTDSLRDTQFYFVTPVICSWNSSVTANRDWDQSKTNIHGYTLRDLCNAIMEVAALYDVAVIDLNLLSGMYYVDAADNNTAVFGGDGVHPGEKGHEMMTSALANVLLQNNLRDDHAHTFGSWITTTWPSCLAGEQQRVCTVCSATERRVLEPNSNHRYYAVITAPTYTQQGYTTYTCDLCGDSYVSDYTDAIQPYSYRWEMQNNTMVSVTTGGNTANELTLDNGSITDGTLTSVRYTLQSEVHLYHNLPWVIEWRSTGNWSGMLFGSTAQSPSSGLTYLFRDPGTNLFALGEYNGSWNNYGTILDCDMTASHVFRLENRIAADGSNGVYLLVDGQEIGAMHHYYIIASNQNKTVNWANGKDILFANIGTTSHPVKGMKLDYLQVWENGEPAAEPEWEVGSIYASSGTNFSSNTRLRTVEYLLLKDYGGVGINRGYTMTNFVYDKDYNYLGTSSWLGSGVGFETEDLQEKYPDAVYFRIALRTEDNETISVSDVEAAGVTFYGPGEDVPVRDDVIQHTVVGNIGSWQDGAIFGGKIFVFNGVGSGAVYDLDTLTKLGTITLDRTDVLKPHANSVCFSNTYYAEADQYPLLYINVYNNYASSADRMEGTCCVYRLTETDGLFTTDLVQVIRVGFTEDLTLWKSKENNGDIRPYGNFLVDTDNQKLYAYVMRDANSTTRFFRFDLPALTDGVYDETYGCNVVTLESDEIETCFDTIYFNYLQGGCYVNNQIFSVEGFTNGTLRIVDLAQQKLSASHSLGEAGLSQEPEVLCIDPAAGILYYAAADGILRTLTIPGVETDHTHSYTSAVTDPTCTEQGYTTYRCACGDRYVDDYVDAAGHDYTDGICTACGERQTSTFQILDAQSGRIETFTYEVGMTWREWINSKYNAGMGSAIAIWVSVGPDLLGNNPNMDIWVNGDRANYDDVICEQDELQLIRYR